ncbi:hypothetical protein TWF730_010371 [Orbilia blumenaviensis]|uniref:Uncharacterized protein n=1 Tax=Orbilia blumenaviensis TaxID=1796055 RepID=A0AAV9URX6_9PEZI
MTTPPPPPPPPPPTPPGNRKSPAKPIYTQGTYLAHAIREVGIRLEYLAMMEQLKREKMIPK